MSTSSYLIIGANRGIGLGLVQKTVEAHEGAKVFATARDPTKATELNALVDKYPGRVVVLQADMLDEASLKAAADELTKHTSTIEVAIFNAGIALGAGRVEDLGAKDFTDNLVGNVVGPHNLFKVFSPFLLASKAERRTIAVISSAVGSLGAFSQLAGVIKQMGGTDFLSMTSYSVSKTAVNMLGRQWADTLEPQGINVALMHPGAVKTDMNPSDFRGMITVEESAASLVARIENLKPEETSTGIVNYDGTIIPW